MFPIPSVPSEGNYLPVLLPQVRALLRHDREVPYKRFCITGDIDHTLKSNLGDGHQKLQVASFPRRVGHHDIRMDALLDELRDDLFGFSEDALLVLHLVHFSIDLRILDCFRTVFPPILES